ncbi:hypothetical protein BKA67DRAFT_180078 [Truncatella angustata]|uniref:peptidylprolyl isomerase n=1 Tax=Truncatella angustata TaxID=152316 RepID=A0A9P8URZ9_9PEZI|nr:uncharacterized protein BKA67DRAFT_180078 [Truncatella angustata]KAH6657121.1 hypothetical protein BKA67DRAFT_180078 [Truncatella angustata]KAH8200398.1 hypothetical protein TruAng_005427 [Truncatella angustata]
MQRLFFALSLVASAAVGALAAEDLKIDVTTAVECDRKTQKGDTIEVHYRGTLTDGKKFDASYDRNTPFSFKLGVGQVIKGWDIGMEGACIGEKRTLTVPPELGYGNRGMGPIPAGSTLIFETEIIGIKGVPKPETIVTKSASSTASSAASAASEVAEEATEKASEKVSEKASSASAGIAEKVASAASVAADVAATVIVDSDDSEDHHEEL